MLHWNIGLEICLLSPTHQKTTNCRMKSTQTRYLRVYKAKKLMSSVEYVSIITMDFLYQLATVLEMRLNQEYQQTANKGHQTLAVDIGEDTKTKSLLLRVQTAYITKKVKGALTARFMVSTWGPSGAKRTQVGPMLAPWTLLSGWLAGEVVNHVGSDGSMVAKGFSAFNISLLVSFLILLLYDMICGVGPYYNLP